MPGPPPKCRGASRATYAPGQPSPPDSDLDPVLVVGDSTACTLLSGLQAVGPSYGMAFYSGTVVGCGVVSGTIAPSYASNGYNFYAKSDECQSEANTAEAAGIEKYRPNLIVWGSTEEHRSVVADHRGQEHCRQLLEPRSGGR